MFNCGRKIGRPHYLMRLILFLCPAIFLQCGTNTKQPVYPLFVFSSVGAPAIVSVAPIQVNLDPSNPQMQFNLSYYITNGEDGFLGYNLRITDASTSAQGSLGTTGTSNSTGPYLPNGTAPSFSHVGAVPSTAPSSLITQRIVDEVPPPGEKQFQFCQLYYFTLSALTRSGLESNQSAQVSSCAAVDASVCPAHSPCNP